MGNRCINILRASRCFRIRKVNMHIPAEQNKASLAVETWQLTRNFGQKIAVNNVTLQVRRGEFFGFLGPNGAGKSTTIKMLTGLMRPSAGTASVAGIDVWQDPLKVRSLMGVLPEYLNLYERLSGREYIRFSGRMYGVSDGDTKRRTEELLAILDLTNDAD